MYVELYYITAYTINILMFCAHHKCVMYRAWSVWSRLKNWFWDSVRKRAQPVCRSSFSRLWRTRLEVLACCSASDSSTSPHRSPCHSTHSYCEYLVHSDQFYIHILTTNTTIGKYDVVMFSHLCWQGLLNFGKKLVLVHL